MDASKINATSARVVALALALYGVVHPDAVKWLSRKCIYKCPNETLGYAPFEWPHFPGSTFQPYPASGGSPCRVLNVPMLARLNALEDIASRISELLSRSLVETSCDKTHRIFGKTI